MDHIWIVTRATLTYVGLIFHTRSLTEIEEQHGPTYFIIITVIIRNELHSKSTLCFCSGSKEEWGVGVTFQKPAQFPYVSAGAAHHSQQPGRYTLTAGGSPPAVSVSVTEQELFKILIIVSLFIQWWSPPTPSTEPTPFSLSPSVWLVSTCTVYYCLSWLQLIIISPFKHNKSLWVKCVRGNVFCSLAGTYCLMNLLTAIIYNQFRGYLLVRHTWLSCGRITFWACLKLRHEKTKHDCCSQMEKRVCQYNHDLCFSGGNTKSGRLVPMWTGDINIEVLPLWQHRHQCRK